MFRFLAKSALAAVIWTRYRRVIVSTLALFITYFLITLFHGDYVDYAVNAGDTGFLWASYLIKWAALIGVTVIYYLYNIRVFVNKPADERPARATGGERRKQDQTDVVPQQDNINDPFAEIRRKKKLKSRSDTLLTADTRIKADTRLKADTRDKVQDPRKDD